MLKVRQTHAPATLTYSLPNPFEEQWTTVRPEGLRQWEIPVTLLGNELLIFRLVASASTNRTTACSAVPQPTALQLVAQCLNQLHYCL